MQKNKITKAVFFGLGSAGQRHLRNLRNLKPNINIFYYKETGKNFLINNKLNKVEGDILKKYNLTLIKRLSDLKAPDIIVRKSKNINIRIKFCILFLGKKLVD